jgi:16S rRNA (guanine527-N7)-methyltransferase
MIDRYRHQLWKWNERMNLTRHTDMEKFVARDVLDSIVFARHLIPEERVLDVGTGGGVPGLILAILRPDVRIEVCESVEKKSGAVGEIVKKLELEVNVWHGRAEELLRMNRYETLTVRAVAKLSKVLHWFRPRWQKFDRLLAMKGPAWVEERKEARHLGYFKTLALRKLEEYEIPGTGSKSVLLQICQQKRLQEIRDKFGVQK